MKRFTKTVSLIISLAMIITVLGGCAPAATTAPSTSGSSVASSSTAPVKIQSINFFNSVGAYLAVLTKLVDAYNAGAGKTEGVKIEMTTNIDNYTTVLEAAIKAGNSPDIFMPNTNMITNGWVMPLDGVKGLEDEMTRFKPYCTIGVNIFGGKTYVFPLEVVPIKMAYNKELFVKAGIVDAKGEAKPPVTLAEQVADAKKITAIGAGKAYGYGFTYQWVVGFRRLGMKAVIHSVGAGWFNNNTGKYDFAPYKPIYEALTQMYADGSMFPGAESIAIDPIRSQFADGNVGMITAPSYDIGVYNDQFPAKMDWGIADAPYFTADGKKFCGVFLSRTNNCISATVKADLLPTAVKAMKMLCSKETLANFYSDGGVILVEKDLMAATKLNVEKKNFKVMADLTNYVSMPNFPDSLLTLEGDNYEVVLSKVMTGKLNVDAAITDLNTRYNAAYQKGVAANKIDKTMYEFTYDMSIK